MNVSLHGKTHALEMGRDWQTSKVTIAKRGKYLLINGLHTDCQFLVGANGSDQQIIGAHKIYLAQSSPVFEVMFFGKMMTEGAVTREPIAIPDLAPSSFQDLLQYMYTESVDLQSLDQAMQLSYAAKKYIMPDLAAKCVLYMTDNISPKYTCRVLQFSDVIEAENLKEKCLSLLREKTVESLATSPDLEVLSESTLLAIVKDQALNISELELFDTLVRWAGNQCTQNNLEINGTNMRQMLGEIVNGIRFLAMNPEEFASSPARSGILDKDEAFNIFMNLINPDSLPMPLHLSSSRDLRGSSFFSRREHGGRSRLTDGIYTLFDSEHDVLTLKEPELSWRIRRVDDATWKEPFAQGGTTFVTDKEIIIKGVVFAGIVLADQQMCNGLDMVLDCYLYDTMDPGTTLATAKVFRTLPRHVTPLTLETVFNSSVRLQPNHQYGISVSFPLRAHFMSGNMESSLSSASCQGVNIYFSRFVINRNSFVRGLVFNLCD